MFLSDRVPLSAVRHTADGYLVADGPTHTGPRGGQKDVYGYPCTIPPRRFRARFFQIRDPHSANAQNLPARAQAAVDRPATSDLPYGTQAGTGSLRTRFGAASNFWG